MPRPQDLAIGIGQPQGPGKSVEIERIALFQRSNAGKAGGMKIEGGHIKKAEITPDIGSHALDTITSITPEDAQAPPGSNHMTVGRHNLGGDDDSRAEVKPPARFSALNLDDAVGHAMIRLYGRYIHGAKRHQKEQYQGASGHGASLGGGLLHFWNGSSGKKFR